MWRFDRSEGPISRPRRPEGGFRPSLQDPTTCQAPPPPHTAFHCPRQIGSLYLRHETVSAPTNRCSTLEHPLPHTRGQTGLWIACATSAP